MSLHGKPVTTRVLAMKQEPGPGPIAVHEPRLVEEGRLHHAGVVSDGRFNKRSHATASDRSRGDASHLGDHRRTLSWPQLGDRPRLAAIPRKMVEQVTDRLKAQGRGGV
jgi:hypothetical protein